MSRRDRDRWDRKWTDADQSPYQPHPLLVEQESYLTGGQALDLACGRGQNAIWLAQRGYQVLGVDISRVAIGLARADAMAHGLVDRVRFQVVDLDHWSPPEDAFDLICVFRFLDRSLFGAIRDGLRSGGLVYYSTRHLGALARHPQANEAFLLRPGELAAAFSNWRILVHEEGAEDAHLVARKPGPD